MSKVQEEFDNCNDSYIVLTPTEYEGPLCINRPCTIDGSFSTLWSKKGPVVIVEAPNVTLKNIRVEVTQKSDIKDENIAIKTNYTDTKLENIEVCGQLEGFQNEAELWNLPPVIRLGDFGAQEQNTFLIEIDAPTDAKLKNKINDIEIFPTELTKGKNFLTIKTNELRNNTILYGEIFVQTNVTRRMYVLGKSVAGATVHNEGSMTFENESLSMPVQIEVPQEVIAQIVSQDNTEYVKIRQSIEVNPDEESLSMPVQTEAPKEIVAPVVSQENIEYLKQGQRIAIKPYEDSVLKICYEHNSVKENVDIDGYAFLLSQNGRVRKDEDLVFFGNQQSSDNAVRISSADNMPTVLAELKKLDEDVEKIAVSFSIYGDNPLENFSLVNSPIVRIFSNEKEIYRYKLKGLNMEKTVVAVEIYRYKGEWKLACVGNGYNDGLKTLCECYGVEVE